MPLIEANFIYITILLLGTLGYVYTLQRPTTYMIRPSRNKDLYKSSNPSKVNFDIKGTQFTYNMAYAHYWQNKPFIKPPDSKRLTRRNIEFTDMLILICYWWLYLNLVSPILQAVGAIYKCVSLNNHIIPVAFVPFCVHVFAWWHASLMFIYNPTCEITFMIISYCRYKTRLVLCCWQKLMNVILWLFISF